MYLNVTKLLVAKLQFNNILRDYLQGFNASQWLILRKKKKKTYIDKPYAYHLLVSVGTQF